MTVPDSFSIEKMMADILAKVEEDRDKYSLRLHGWRVVLQDGKYRFQCYDGSRSGSFVPEMENLPRYLAQEAAVVLPPTLPARPRSRTPAPLVLNRKYVASTQVMPFKWKLVTYHPEGHVVSEEYLGHMLNRTVERRNRA